ncbi:RagB/SusD family nutrient uptake outer membrane protein [Olivibacter jilunii]|uniref:RagB/SusD family nutrient uptake outer membrane protein n=1 Tax=Olivibacter jilunii TaxID=985016 RepID=UPI001030A158|nr:RagB/SusD family nutrient uptake outer membrane protein [Olivibacter jilunii]
MKKISAHIILPFLLLPMLLSCERFLEVDPPNDRLETSTVFSDSTSVALAISGTYSDLMGTNTGFLASMIQFTFLSSDELTANNSSAYALSFLTNNLLPDDRTINRIWMDLYRKIYQLNQMIEGIENSSSINDSAKHRFIGEAKFLRAFFFFYTVNYWGDVPLTLTTDYRVNEIMPRIPSEEIYGQIIRDLSDAIDTLPDSYPSTEKVRPNKLAAAALLSRVQLYLENWQEAESLSDRLISSELYLPLPTLAGTFKKESRETIWQLYPANSASQETYEGLYFIPTSLTDNVIPFYLIPDELYESFENEDERKVQWIGSKPSAGSYHFPYKYKARTKIATQEVSEYTIVLRLSEQYLIRAESRTHLGDYQGAVQDLNVIRTRAGLNELPVTLSESEIFEAIEKERRHELFCEWGHRWFDLKRTGKSEAVLKPVKGDNWQTGDMLWPIPLSQLLANPNLIQNEGY